MTATKRSAVGPRQRRERDPAERVVKERAILRQRRDHTLYSGAIRADVELLRTRYVVAESSRRRPDGRLENVSTPITYVLMRVLVVDESTGAVLADRDLELRTEGEHAEEPTRSDLEAIVGELLDSLVQIDWSLGRRVAYDSRAATVILTWDPDRAVPPEFSRSRRGAKSTVLGGGATREERLRIARLMSLATSPNFHEADAARRKANELLRRFGLRASDVAREFGVYRRSQE